MLTFTIILLVIVLIAALWEFELMHMPDWGPTGIALYFIFFLAVVILIVGVTEQVQQVVMNTGGKDWRSAYF